VNPGLTTPAISTGRSVLDLELDRRSPVPVYVQISDAIRARIRSGELQPDSVLPPSQQLCDKLGITRMTLRQAYNVLAREGLVDAQRGRGTFVRHSRIERTLSQMVGFSEEMRAWGKTPSSRLLSFQRAEASEAARDFLGQAVVYRISRLRLADAVPMAIEAVEIPVTLCPALENFDLAARSLYEILDEAYGIRYSRCEQVVSATVATRKEKALLEIGPRVALLRVTRRSYIKPDRAATYGITTYRGDLYTATVHGERRLNSATRP
jgi:GntR family transcriptional regulator